jgi:hypothetical protein
MPRTVVGPNRLLPVNLNNSGHERDPTVRCELQGAPGALRAGTGGLRSVPTEEDAGAFVTRSAAGLGQTRDEGGGLCPTNQIIQPM